MYTRKYLSKYEKLKKKKEKEKKRRRRQREELIESQKELWTNLLLVKKNLAKNLSEGFINEQEIHQKELEDNENIQQNDNNKGGHDNFQTCNVTILDNEAQNNLEESEHINDQPNYFPTNIFDLGQWKTIDIKLRDLLVENGPIRVDDLNFPIDKNSRHFFYYTLYLKITKWGET